jgi:hypothetical protein
VYSVGISKVESPDRESEAGGLFTRANRVASCELSRLCTYGSPTNKVSPDLGPAAISWHARPSRQKAANKALRPEHHSH